MATELVSSWALCAPKVGSPFGTVPRKGHSRPALWTAWGQRSWLRQHRGAEWWQEQGWSWGRAISGLIWLEPALTHSGRRAQEG